MGRIVAIDYGKKRVGVAATDSCRIIANGITTVGTCEILNFLQEYVAREQVDLFVVGHPKQLDNTDSESMIYIRPFIVSLKRKFPDIPIEMFDERFTSVLAHRALLESGAKKKQRRNKALIDTISATIILQSYMENLRSSSV